MSNAAVVVYNDIVMPGSSPELCEFEILGVKKDGTGKIRCDLSALGAEHWRLVMR